MGEDELEDEKISQNEVVNEVKAQVVEEDLQEQAEIIKAKYKVNKLYLITVEGEAGDSKSEYRGWIRKPNLKEFSMFASMTAKNEVIAGGQAILRTCFLEGDPELINDEDILLGAVNQLEELLKVRNATIAKF